MFTVLKWIIVFIAVVIISHIFFPEQLKSVVEYISEIFFINKELITEKFNMIVDRLKQVYVIFLGVLEFIKSYFN